MRNFIFVLIALFMIGCNNSSDPAPQPIPDYVTDYGIAVFADIDLTDLDDWYVQTKQCLQMEAPPPIVHVVESTKPYCGFKAQGGACQGEIYIVDDYIKWGWLWKHEFIHFIMRANNDNRHATHEPKYLWQCQFN